MKALLYYYFHSTFTTGEICFLNGRLCSLWKLVRRVQSPVNSPCIPSRFHHYVFYIQDNCSAWGTHRWAWVTGTLAPLFLDLFNFFPKNLLKGTFTSAARRSLKSSSVVTDPQILTFKLSGRERERKKTPANWNTEWCGSYGDRHTNKRKCLLLELWLEMLHLLHEGWVYFGLICVCQMLMYEARNMFYWCEGGITME